MMFEINTAGQFFYSNKDQHKSAILSFNLTQPSVNWQQDLSVDPSANQKSLNDVQH